MRRYIVSALLSLFVLQSSGAALANAPGDPRMRLSAPNIASIIHPVLSAIESSQLFAEFTDGVDRYALMHMAMPHLTHKIVTTAAPILNVSPSRLVKPEIIHGTPEHFVFPKHPPRERTHDPLAMHRAPSLGSPSLAPRIIPGRPLSAAPVLAPRAGAPLQHQVASRTTQSSIAANTLAEPSKRAPSGPSPNGLASTDTGAGVNPYWTYQKRAIPGLGTAMVNVGTGNLVVQTTDVDIPERGVDLAFTRTYNSQSLHDTNGDDGSQPSIFGNLWTNTYDAHIVFRYSGQTVNAISVYDVDGTRCDYAPQTNGTWKACVGQYATLEVDPSNPCMYWLIRKDGSSLLFHTDAEGGGCTPPQANLGRLYAIYGRNSNNNITFNYSFSGQNKTSQNITQIVVNHSDGQSLTLNFAQFSGINELSTITYPKPGAQGQTAEIDYKYDSAGDLLEVDKPGNDATPDLSNFGVISGDLPQTYGYTQPLQFLHACGPRATISLWKNQPNPATDGACIHFDFDSNVRLTDWQVNGILNPQIGDQGYLQPNEPTGWNQWYTGYFVYGAGGNNPPCTGTQNGTTTNCDSDGHSTIWTINTPGYTVAQTQMTTGKSSPTNLFTTETWDGSYNLIASTDPRGDETDYAYDSMGNLTALALPAPGISDVSGKSNSFRATTLYSYDQNTNNILAVCDSSYTDVLGKDWTGNPGHSDSLCPQTIGSQNSQGARVYQYDTSDSAEPYGRLTHTYTPMGYETTVSYNQTSQGGGDYGLPTTFQGTPFLLNDKKTQIQQEKNLSYDGFGNIVTDGNTIGTWTTNYNDVNWPTSVTDPTGVTSYSCYNEDGSVSYTTSALQAVRDGGSCGNNSVHYQHDTDGDTTEETRHPNSTSGNYNSASTIKWYDGLDRLVEVELPSGGNIDSGNVNKTRYIYDVTQSGGSGNLAVGNTGGIIAYGNLYKTQRCIGSTCSWGQTGNDVSGNAYDALNRPTARYQYTPTMAGTNSAPGTNPGPLEAWTFTYDQSNQQGLPTTLKDPIGTHTTLTYDDVNRIQSKSFDDGITPAVTGTFDLDGRIATLSSAAGVEHYTYDFDGRLGTYAEGGAIKDPETLTYAYYPNAWRSNLQINDSSAGYNQSYGYDYYADGTRKDLTFGSQSFSWAYDNAGRTTSQIDPFNGVNIPSNNNPNYPSGIALGPKTMQYDGKTGVLTQLTLPNGAQYQNIVYDADGEVTGYGVSFPAFSANQQNSPNVTGVEYTYDNRAESIQTLAKAPSQQQYQSLQQLQYFISHPVVGTSGNGIDSNTGATFTPDTPSQTDSNGCLEPQSVSYDADGRQVRDFVSYTGSQCQNQSHSPTLADTRVYDAENHLTQDTCSYTSGLLTICAASGGASYTWGPSGHLSTIGSDTVHWDGDNLAFITNGSDNVVQVNIERLGWRTSANGTIAVDDRDSSGTTVSGHTTNSDTGLTAAQDQYRGKIGLFFGIPTINGQYPGLGSFPTGQVLGARRTDGYSTGSAVTFQGVRTYDTNTAQWTTPDDNKGNADSPSSQMQYEWNYNNPVSNVDVNGHDPFSTLHDILCDQFPGEFGCDSLQPIQNGEVCATASGGPCSTTEQPQPSPEEAAQTLSETDAGPSMWFLAAAAMMGPDGESSWIGKMTWKGIVVKNPRLPITQMDEHVLEKMAERGVTRADIDSVMQNPTAVILQDNGRFLYLSEQGAVVQAQDGGLVTTWGPLQMQTSYQQLLEMLSKPPQ